MLRGLVVFSLVLAELVGCKTRRDEAKVADAQVIAPLSLSSQPPQFGYQWGNISYLHNYGKRPRPDHEIVITDSEWETITDSKRNFLPFHREGFYFAEHPSSSESYGASAPWLVRVTIAESCRESGRVTDLSSPELANCQRDTLSASPYEKTPGCFAPIKAFLQSHNIGIVKDMLWPTDGYWYVIDPKCIVALDGTAESILKSAATVPLFWNQQPFSVKGEQSIFNNGAQRLQAVIRAALETKLSDVALLAAVRNNATTSDLKPEHWRVIQDYLSLAYSCAKAGDVSAFAQSVDTLLKADARNIFNANVPVSDQIAAAAQNAPCPVVPVDP